MSNTLGGEIRRLRKSKKITQSELAEKIGYSRTYLADTESNRRTPSVSYIKELAKGLNVSKLYLYKAAGYLDETDILNLVDENKRLREALEFYADEANYAVKTVQGWEGTLLIDDSIANEDEGEIAREALQK